MDVEASAASAIAFNDRTLLAFLKDQAVAMIVSIIVGGIPLDDNFTLEIHFG